MESEQTIAQSFNCVARGGEIDIVGFLTGQGQAEGGPSYLQPMIQACTVRGIEVSNRIQFEEMNRAIEAFDIRPVVDDHWIKGFSLENLKGVYQYVSSQQQYGKVALRR